MNRTERLQKCHTAILAALDSCANKEKLPYGKDGVLFSLSAGQYHHALWPEDHLCAMEGKPDILSRRDYASILGHLTESVVDLRFLPDAVEDDGTPATSLAGNQGLCGYRMPPPLPSAYIRLLAFFERQGLEIPEKDRWGAIIARCVDAIEFSCGLVFINRNWPYVTFPLKDIVANTGLELMSSVILYRGLLVGAELFADTLDQDVLYEWRRKARRIKENLWRLYDPEKKIFLAGSRDCRQGDIFGSGLAYGLATKEQRQGMVEHFLAHQDILFWNGMTRHMVEKDGWQRLLCGYPADHYMNGGYWPVGTGYLFTGLYEQAPDFALDLLEALLASMPMHEYAESVNRDGTTNAKYFMTALGVLSLTTKASLEGRQLIDII